MTAATTAAVSVPTVESFDYSIPSADTAEQFRRSAASISFHIQAELARPDKNKNKKRYDHE